MVALPPYGEVSPKGKQLGVAPLGELSPFHFANGKEVITMSMVISMAKDYLDVAADIVNVVLGACTLVQFIKSASNSR